MDERNVRNKNAVVRRKCEKCLSTIKIDEACCVVRTDSKEKGGNPSETILNRSSLKCSDETNKRKDFDNENVLPRKKSIKYRSPPRYYNKDLEQKNGSARDLNKKMNPVVHSDRVKQSGGVVRVGLREPLNNAEIGNMADGNDTKCKGCFYDDGAAKGYKYNMLYNKPLYPS